MLYVFIRMEDGKGHFGTANPHGSYRSKLNVPFPGLL